MDSLAAELVSAEIEFSPMLRSIKPAPMLTKLSLQSTSILTAFSHFLTSRPEFNNACVERPQGFLITKLPIMPICHD